MKTIVKVGGNFPLIASLLLGCHSSDDSTVTPGSLGTSSSITGILSATTNTSTSTTGLARVVALAEAFKATLNSTQLSTVQFRGHHYTFANTYNGGKVTGVTPSFRPVEQLSAVTANNRNYQPIEQERQAYADLLMNLSSSEQIAAKLSSTFSDVLLGPGKDGQFSTSKSGIRAGELNAERKHRCSILSSSTSMP